MPDQGGDPHHPGAAVRLPDADADIRAQPAFERPSRPAPDERGGAEAPRLGGDRAALLGGGDEPFVGEADGDFQIRSPRHPADGFGPVEQPVGEQPGRGVAAFPGTLPPPARFVHGRGGPGSGRGAGRTSISCPSQTIRLTIPSAASLAVRDASR